MLESVIIPSTLKPNQKVIDKVNNFLESYRPYESENNLGLILFFDAKSSAYYLICHLSASILSISCDLDATLDGDEEDEIYKLNRDITEDQSAYKIMEEDAVKGRSFEDIVIEFDTSYRKSRPLKVYGGQHRVKAIQRAENTNGKIVHGVRVYFDLSRDQKVEIATINNTSIAVPNDLLDRMREQLMGSELRDWCQTVGLLDKGKDFADRKSPDNPTVRIARTLLVNYHLGLNGKLEDFHQPIVCKSGGIDEDYLKIRDKVDWLNERLVEMGKQFARLHRLQRDTVSGREEDSYGEFARRALSLSVVAGWAYAAGLFQIQSNTAYLKNLYSLPDSVSPPDDPLNAKALSLARLKGSDPDTYRGLGTRSSPNELGRMLEVFLVFATKASKKRITKELANAAIQSYEAKRATFKANKVLEQI